MTENKRFIEFATQNTDNGEINNGFNDIKTGEWYYTKDSENAKKICGLLNTLSEENEQLKQDKDDLIDFIKKEHPITYKFILEEIWND